MTVLVEADFLADLRRIVIAQLTSEGYAADASLGTEALVWNFLKVKHRQIERRTRRSEWSSELRGRQGTLSTDILSALGRIVIAAESGDDLNPYLSRDMVSDKAFKREDLMLNELGVHHLHLGEGVDNRGIVRGRDELLFAYVTDEAIHFVEVYERKRTGRTYLRRDAGGARRLAVHSQSHGSKGKCCGVIAST
jgi:hypothetical protein